MKQMKIGNYNLFEAGCTISSSEIGDLNEFNHKCFVEDNCKIGNQCQVGPRVSLPVGTRMGNNMVAYEDGKLMSNEESSSNDTKKPKMKELCNILGVQLAKHNKLKSVPG